MESLSLGSLASYWSIDQIAASLLVFMNLFGALLLGLVVGYERSYHGRAAGMRTYGLVCMASAGLTVIAGSPAAWFGGHAHVVAVADPTRVIQGIVTGIGFLGAGVIMREGMNISGLTTAASLWASSAIGILVGVALYPAAILLTLLSAGVMMWGSRLEAWLPSRPAIGVVLHTRRNMPPRIDLLRESALRRGYEVAQGSISINYREGEAEWRFVVTAIHKNTAAPITALAEELANFEGVVSFNLTFARN